MRNYAHHINQKELIPVNVSVKDNYGNVVASGNYTTAGTYNLSFTPASTSATYTLEFYMTKASAFCFFRVDDVLVSYEDTTTVTVCKEVEDGYRYGFNNMEKDDEIKGAGNWYTFGDYGYDPRIVQRPSPDPHWRKYPSQSPYSVFNGNPIMYIDPNGRDGIVAIRGNTITVTSKIFIWGDGATKEVAKQMQNDIMNAWNFDKNGENWT